MKVDKILLIILGIILSGLAWAGADSGKLLPSGKGPEQGAVVAQVNGRVITAQALEKRAEPALSSIERMVHRLKESRLEKMINQVLIQQEAKRRGLSREALVVEVTDFDRIPVSEEEAEEFYQDNTDLFPEGKETAREKIRGLVREEKAAEKLEEFAATLREKAKIVIFLPGPPSPQRQRPSSGPGGKPPAQSEQVPPGEGGVIAQVNGATITARALEEKLENQLYSLQKMAYAQKKGILEKMIGEVLVKEEARKRGVSEEVLFEAVTHASAIPIPDEEWQNIYRSMKRGVAPQDEQALREKIRQRLRRRKAFPQWQEFIEGLKAKAKIKIHLKPPTPPAQH